MGSRERLRVWRRLCQQGKGAPKAALPYITRADARVARTRSGGLSATVTFLGVFLSEAHFHGAHKWNFRAKSGSGRGSRSIASKSANKYRGSGSVSSSSTNSRYRMRPLTCSRPFLSGMRRRIIVGRLTPKNAHASAHLTQVAPFESQLVSVGFTSGLFVFGFFMLERLVERSFGKSGSTVPVERTRAEQMRRAEGAQAPRMISSSL